MELFGAFKHTVDTTVLDNNIESVETVTVFS